MNQKEAAREAQELRETQAVKKTFDYVISFVAKAGQAGSVSIPINSDGDFHQLGYNIRHSKNSIWEHTVNGSTVQTNFSNLKLKFSSQAANGQQSNDFITLNIIFFKLLCHIPFSPLLFVYCELHFPLFQ